MKLRTSLLLVALVALLCAASADAKKRRRRPRTYVAPCIGGLNVTFESCYDAYTEWVDVGEGSTFQFRYDGPPGDNFIVRMMPSGVKVFDSISRTEIGNFAVAALPTGGDHFAQITVVPGGLCGLWTWTWSVTCATNTTERR